MGKLLETIYVPAAVRIYFSETIYVPLAVKGLIFVALCPLIKKCKYYFTQSYYNYIPGWVNS